MSSLPPEFIGVWERIQLIVDGQEVGDAGRSFWFQAGSRFLDVRAAGGGLRSEAFAGVTTWDEATATLRWSHELDMHPDGRDDAGRVEWVDGDLVEHGSAEQFGDVIRYTEVWRQRAVPDAQVVIADRVGGRGRLAWCGHLGALTIDNRSAGPLQGGVFTDRGWACVFDIVHGVPLGLERRSMSEVLMGEGFERWGQTGRLRSWPSLHTEPIATGAVAFVECSYILMLK